MRCGVEVAADDAAAAVAEEAGLAELAKAVWGALGRRDVEGTRGGDDAGEMGGAGCLCGEGDEEAEEEVGGDGLEGRVHWLTVGVVGGAAQPGSSEREDRGQGAVVGGNPVE